MNAPDSAGSVLCTVQIEHPIVCGKPHTRLLIGRADKPGTTIIDWTQMTALRHNHADLAARLESGQALLELSIDDLSAIKKLASFNAWPDPVPAVTNPRPHYIDMLPHPMFTRLRKA